MFMCSSMFVRVRLRYAPLMQSPACVEARVCTPQCREPGSLCLFGSPEVYIHRKKEHLSGPGITVSHIRAGNYGFAYPDRA